ncbi:MotB family protein [Microvirga terricola]|uniref:MotB family protein n=1 Tax=Microvirga terricola TaxID=2719797 RepID=A0ABX0V578_9HYPH|nr:MotB family protein [Microvirga terricola]NIX75002.1 MotB family protein [Microvirga terricola]
MADPTKQEIIIVRRYEAEEEQHKGGVWKIAHADFMTAMMAFFLVMWLISAMGKETKASVANYFNPIHLAESTPDRKGLKESNNTPSQSEPETEKKPLSTKVIDEAPGGPSPRVQRPRFKEGALFQDPYAILAKLAAEAEQEHQPEAEGVELTPGTAGEPGMNGGEVYRDPFDPLYWQMASMPKPKSNAPGDPQTVSPVPKERKLDVLASPQQATAETRVKDSGNAGVTAAQPAEKETRAEKQAVNSQESQIQAEIAKVTQSSGKAGPHIEVSRTGEGILISVTDEIDFSMFAIGSAEPQPKVVQAMERIAKIISSRPGKIVIRGHTDGRPFKSDTYDNWRLSTARAHMASYMLVRGGVSEARIERVEGHADRSLKNASDPKDAVNRRIEILLREPS